MTVYEFSGLFELHVRGVLAQAFMHRNIAPTDVEWKMLRGEVNITARDIGEMCYRLDVRPELVIGERNHG